MKFSFRDYVRVTREFFFVRFVVSLFISVIYLFIAAAIQYSFVRILGESTFNYIVCGLLSLLCGVAVCKYLGDLVLMFVKGWHVAALAYAKKIDAVHGSALDIGIRVFNKHLATFGIVYGIREVTKNVLADFKDRLWDLLTDVPHVNTLKRFATNPIVEHISNDILHYGFDATVFYLIRHPADDIDAIPEISITAVKKYLYCLPEIAFSSVQTYIMFRFLPKLAKNLIIIGLILRYGLVAGILINVLAMPVFYILNIAFFDPLTMIFFLAVFSRKCDKPVDENSIAAKVIKDVLEGAESIKNDKPDEDDEGDSEEEEKPKKKAKKDDEEEAEPESESESDSEDEEPKAEEPVKVEEPMKAEPESKPHKSISDYAAESAKQRKSTADAFRSLIEDDAKSGSKAMDAMRERLMSKESDEDVDNVSLVIDDEGDFVNPVLPSSRTPTEIRDTFASLVADDLLANFEGSDD